MQLAMEKEITLIHILLDKDFILMCILTSDAEVVLARDEPVELLKPKYLTILVGVSHYCDFVLLEISKRSLLRLLDCNNRGILGLHLLLH